MFFKYNIFTLLWLVIVFLLVLITGENIASMEYPHIDKVVHVLLFSALSFMMNSGFVKQDRSMKLRFKAPIYAVSLAALAALLIELLQWAVTQRPFDGFSFLSDLVGCILGYFLFILVYQILK